MKPGILVSTPDLRPSLYSILKGLDEAHLLKGVVTTIAFNPRNVFGKAIKNIKNITPSGLRNSIEKRIIPDFLFDKIKTIPTREMMRLLAQKTGNTFFANRVWLWAELGFDLEVAKKYGGRFRSVYGMEHSSLNTFAAQKNLGGLCILRAVTIHVRTAIDTIMREIMNFPEYAGSYGKMFEEDIDRTMVRKEEEYRLADLIVANSYFVKDTFTQRGVNPEKLIVVPTGSPAASHVISNSGRGKKPLIFLFVGSLSLGKGFLYLLESWRLLKPGKAAELWLVGRKQIPMRTLTSPEDSIRYFGTVSKSNLAKLYEKADILVLPTLFEGLASVVLEGLSFGMPVITTKESGCGDFVQNGHNGFIIRPRDAKMLCEKMTWCLENREKLKEMGKASLQAAESWTVADSNRAHLNAVVDFLRKKG